MNGTNNSQFQVAANIDLQAFHRKLQGVRNVHRSFTSYIRTVFPMIEEAIEEGVPLEALLAFINEQLGLCGSMSGFKSALYRIRRERESKRILGLPPDADMTQFVVGATPPGGAPYYYAPEVSQPPGQSPTPATGGTMPLAGGLQQNPYQQVPPLWAPPAVPGWGVAPPPGFGDVYSWPFPQPGQVQMSSGMPPQGYPQYQQPGGFRTTY